MKVISYSIFRGEGKQNFEFQAYLRGIYFNARMNRLIYPEWITWTHIESSVYKQYEDYFLWLANNLGIKFFRVGASEFCTMMLYRIALCFYELPISYIICRDSDAITTLREAQSVQRWIQSGKDAHVIHDNSAHGGLMGGMVGFKADAIRKHFAIFSDLIKGFDLRKHGSDQHLMNQRILPLVKDSLYTDVFPKEDRSNRLWESNLCCSFIGSAGFNELETLRFFRKFDNKDRGEKEFKDILYFA